MSKLRITGAMLRPKAPVAPAADEPQAESKAAEPAHHHHEAVASHPQFVAPQFGYRRTPSVPSTVVHKPNRAARPDGSR